MKSLTDLNAEHAAAVAKLEAEHALASLMPAAPDSVQLSKGRRPSWIIYRKRSLTAALELMALFHCVPLYRHEGTFCELVPDGCADEKAEQVAGPFACVLDVNQGDGFGPSATLFFYAGVDDPALAPQSRLVRIVIDIDGPDYIGAFSSLGASFVPIAWTPRRGEPSEWRVGPSSALNGLADSYVQWAGEKRKREARFSYLFCADQEAAAPMAEQTHAMGQLRNLRDEFQPPAELIESTARADYYRIPVPGGRDVFAAVKPGAPAPANVAGYYDLAALKSLKGDS